MEQNLNSRAQLGHLVLCLQSWEEHKRYVTVCRLHAEMGNKSKSGLNVLPVNSPHCPLIQRDSSLLWALCRGSCTQLRGVPGAGPWYCCWLCDFMSTEGKGTALSASATYCCVFQRSRTTLTWIRAVVGHGPGDPKHRV